MVWVEGRLAPLGGEDGVVAGRWVVRRRVCGWLSTSGVWGWWCGFSRSCLGLEVVCGQAWTGFAGGQRW